MAITEKPRCPTCYAFDQNGRLVAVRCGSWYCPHCAKLNARMWSWRVRLHMENAGKPAWFWTLTLMPSVQTPEDGFKKLPKLWNRLRMYMKRMIPEKWSYCAFVEGQPQRDYMPHFHIISMQKAPKRFKDMAVWRGFGFEAKEKQVSSGKAASYVAKYASKQSPVTPKGFRRVRASQDWQKLPPVEHRTLYVRAKAEKLLDYLQRVEEATGIDVAQLAETWLQKKDALETILLAEN